MAIVITAGACHAAPWFETVFAQLPDAHELDHGVMDTGYDRDKIREKLREEDMEPVIPARSKRNEPYAYDKDIYTLRNKVERFMNRLKQFRRIATRDEKLSITFLGLIHLVAVYVATH